MKMILAVIRDEISENVSQALVAEGFRVTRIASSGGFLRRGMTTMMIGVEDEKLDAAIEQIRINCPHMPEGGTKNATLFVINVAHFEQL